MITSHDKQPSSSAACNHDLDIVSTRLTPTYWNDSHRLSRRSFPSSVKLSMSASILPQSCLLGLNFGYSKAEAERRALMLTRMETRKGTGASRPRPLICLMTVSRKRRMATRSGPVCESILGRAVSQLNCIEATGFEWRRSWTSSIAFSTAQVMEKGQPTAPDSRSCTSRSY